MNGMDCTWDFRDRLVAVEDETMRAEYRYDYAGRRVLKRVTWKLDERGAGE
jgi:YD repeat-containing protein